MISKQMRRKPAETCSSASPLYANSLPAGMRRTCSPKTMGVKRRIWTFGYAGSRNGTSLNSKIILALKHCKLSARGEHSSATEACMHSFMTWAARIRRGFGLRQVQMVYNELLNPVERSSALNTNSVIPLPCTSWRYSDIFSIVTVVLEGIYSLRGCICNAAAKTDAQHISR
jgi:hypothetical protein